MVQWPLHSQAQLANFNFLLCKPYLLYRQREMVLAGCLEDFSADRRKAAMCLNELHLRASEILICSDEQLQQMVKRLHCNECASAPRATHHAMRIQYWPSACTANGHVKPGNSKQHCQYNCREVGRSSLNGHGLYAMPYVSLRSSQRVRCFKATWSC